MFVLRASDLTGNVVVLSFTFAATAHAVAWNRLRPVFADIDPETLTLSPESVRKSIGVADFGCSRYPDVRHACHVEELQDVADRSGVRVFFDAAHALARCDRGPHREVRRS